MAETGAATGSDLGSRHALPLFVMATVASYAGTRLSTVAIPWFVLTTTHSATATGAVALAELLPYVVVKAVGGPLIDRVGASRVAVGSDVASAFAVSLIPILHALGFVSFPVLLALVALIGVLRGPGDGAKATLIPEVSQVSGASLERVSGAFGVVDRLAATLGTALGGFIVAAVGGVLALWVTVAAFLLSSLVLTLGLVPALRGVERPARPPRAATSSYLRELRDGWVFLRTDAVLLALVLMLSVTNLLEQAYAAVLVPVWALTHGEGPSAVGLIFATSSAAAVLGSLAAAALAERLRRRPIYIVGYLLVGLPRFAVLAFGAPLPVVLFVLAIGGLAGGFINPILGAIVMERIPPHLMGRVNSLVMALAWSLLPFGGLLAGVLVSGMGLATTLWIVGGLYILATMWPTLLPAWAGIDRPLSEDSSSTEPTPASSPVQAATPGRPPAEPHP
ncbi:MFS transporter [Gephyromycinifex aptenodytis]|uniref:MFS transporter n=1 Tax=Gephyromycinifex aptenodytis TaxID=2716227 RepID=UPI00144833F0|nr:MFS transporter [Gephyromycinifex aptenodytis]